MDGKRFGVGLAAGLLVALAIVGASGLANSPLTASFAKYSAGPAVTTAASSTSFSVTSTSTAVAMTNGVTTTSSSVMYTATTNTVPEGTLSNVSAATTSTSTESKSVNSSTPQGHTFGTAAQNAATQPSNLANIPTQPVLSTGFVLVPVLVAFLLGALLYRASVGNREKDAEDEQGS